MSVRVLLWEMPRSGSNRLFFLTDLTELKAFVLLWWKERWQGREQAALELKLPLAATATAPCLTSCTGNAAQHRILNSIHVSKVSLLLPWSIFSLLCKRQRSLMVWSQSQSSSLSSLWPHLESLVVLTISTSNTRLLYVGHIFEGH